MQNDEPASGAASQDDEDFLAALGNMPPIEWLEALSLIQEDRDRYFVDTLPPMPAVDGGVSDGNLYRLPARAHGDGRHGESWVIVVDVDDDIKQGDSYATREEGQAAYARRLALWSEED